MRYFLGLLIGLGLIILFIILLVRLIFGGGGEQQKPKTDLLTYSDTNVVMRLLIDGPINADQDHRRIQIDVSDTMNELSLLTGYQGNVQKTQSFASNSSAYANFLRAIDLQGYTQGKDSKDLTDERGFCPGGNRYIFEIVDGANIKQRYWSTSCGGTKSFDGQVPVILNLFKAQIPGYTQQVAGFGLE
jgi:hypothetical protein